MSITSLADIATGVRQSIFLLKQNNAASGNLYSSWPSVGIPGVGSGAGNTTSGIVPTNATAGAPAIVPFSGDGYIVGAHLADSVGGMFIIADRVFACGAYAANASQALTGQPSYVLRMPNGSYVGTQLWIENFGALGGAPSITVTYTDQDGNTGHSTGAWLVNGATTVASVIPLAPGDTGVQMVESVAMTGTTGNTWQIVVVRPLILMRVLQKTSDFTPTSVPLEALGMPVIYPDSCISVFGREISSAVHTFSLVLDIVSG